MAEGQPKIHVLTPDEEYAYWEENYVECDYIDRSLNYETSYGPAYHYGVHAAGTHGKRFEEVDESALRAGWEQHGRESELDWEQAKHVVRDAHNRVIEKSIKDETNVI